MNPGETIRYACGDCQVVFDLYLAPVSEWTEEIEAGFEPDDMTPNCCPFCGSAELKARHDRAVQVG